MLVFICYIACIVDNKFSFGDSVSVAKKLNNNNNNSHKKGSSMRKIDEAEAHANFLFQFCNYTQMEKNYKKNM